VTEDDGMADMDVCRSNNGERVGDDGDDVAK
jgi:hypothetical protein